MAEKKEEYDGMFQQPTAEDWKREQKRLEQMYSGTKRE